ncbi:C40 family peptidase [Limosilactobacillus kribbianus]|uniref:C40 family peptidase n=1 Tax=Limosilactobacillus kribbianus TaxID=2982695 RepID=UPI0022647439|nr:C40 family peptidase [Limosilactobacillus kribbianus]
MVKRVHHRSVTHYLLMGTLGAVGALAVSTQIASANSVLVKAGDTVWKIAQENKTTVKAIENANGGAIKKVSNSVDLIYAGQRLQLPGSDQTMADADANGYYTVAPGDTLSKIAEHFNLSVSTLKALNGLTSDQLYIGQRLLVDGSQATAVLSTPDTQQTAVTTSITNTPVSQSVETTATSAQETVVATPASASTVSATDPVSAAGQMSTAAAVNTDSSAVSQAVSEAPSEAPATSPAANQTSLSNSTSTQTALSTATSQVSASSAVAQSQSTAAQTQTFQASAVASTASVTNSQAAAATSAEAVTSTSQAQSVASQTVAESSAATSTPVSQGAGTVTTSTTTPVSTSQPQASATTSTTAVSQVSSQQVNSQAQQKQTTQSATTQTQSQTAATTTANQNQSTTTSDLQSGSVVSLAVKIANSNSVPYVWGGSSLSGTDCSGLVDYVYKNAEGKQLPHNTVALESCVNQHSVSQAQAGDILFWGQHGATYHCAIYIGNNQYVAAAKPGTNVATYTISSYFMPSFAGTVK